MGRGRRDPRPVARPRRQDLIAARRRDRRLRIRRADRPRPRRRAARPSPRHPDRTRSTAMLDANLTAQLKTYLEKITQPDRARRLARRRRRSRAELRRAARRDRRAVRPHHRSRRDDDDARRPSFADRPRRHRRRRSRFAGIPMGHEFTSLVLALLQVGGHPSTADGRADRADRASLEGDYHFETYFSLTCQNCPDVVQALNLMSVLNPNITPRRHRRRAVPGRGRRAPGHGRARPCSSTASRSTRAA